MHEAVFEAGWKQEKLMEQQRRVISPIHHQKNRLAYRKRTEIAVEIVGQ